nr:hypothetical protein [Tanacetum cinerariifolium]
EAAEAIRLHGQVVVVEAAKDAQASELNGLNKQNALSYNELSIKATSLESEKDGLVGQVLGYEPFNEHIKAVQDEKVMILSDKVAGIDADLIEMALHLDEEFYPYFLTTIAKQG